MSDAAELQQKVQQLQALTQQVQQIAQQRQQFEAMKMEGSMATEALEAMPDDGTVFRNVGSLLVQDNKADALARIKDDAETMDIRIDRMKKQEDAGREQLDALQEELQAAFEAQQK